MKNKNKVKNWNRTYDIDSHSPSSYLLRHAATLLRTLATAHSSLHKQIASFAKTFDASITFGKGVSQIWITLLYLNMTMMNRLKLVRIPVDNS
jgi:hypothetical protein